MTHTPTVIIGAGISGVTVAKRLASMCLVLEATQVAGGLSTQYPSGDYWFDYGGHYFHFQDKEAVKDYVETFHQFKQYNRDSKAYLLNRFIPFPVQFHLSHFPKRTARAILNEILKRRDTEAVNLYDHLRGSFGATLFHLFFEPFMSKYYGYDLRLMAARMDRGSIPVPDHDTVRQGFEGKKFTAGYNPVFFYPQKGLRAFFDDYAREAEDNIHFGQKVMEIDLEKKTVHTEGNLYHYDQLVSTMPLKNLLTCVKQKTWFPDPGQLTHTSTLICNVVLKKKRRRFHWLYLPERRIPFYRAGYYPAHEYPVCYLEKSLPPGTNYDPRAVQEEIAFTLEELRLVETGSDIVHTDLKLIPISYIIFDLNWRATVPAILQTLRQHDVYSIGRYGAWTYSSMSDDIQTALRTADEISSLDPGT